MYWSVRNKRTHIRLKYISYMAEQKQIQNKNVIICCFAYAYIAGENRTIYNLHSKLCDRPINNWSVSLFMYIELTKFQNWMIIRFWCLLVILLANMLITTGCIHPSFVFNTEFTKHWSSWNNFGFVLSNVLFSFEQTIIRIFNCRMSNLMRAIDVHFNENLRFMPKIMALDWGLRFFIQPVY